MKLIDLHCDTFSRMYEENILNVENNDLHIDLNKLRKADSYLQVFALFDNKDKTDYKLEEFNKLIDFAFDLINKNKEKYNLIKKYDEIKDNGKQNILISAEDMGSVDGDFKNIKFYYDRGIRIGTLTWNYENSLGFPNTMDSSLGLKPFGKEAVEYMNELGMIVDVSHLNDGGFYDVYDISTKPFIASHSCSRELCNHTRNLKDDMIRIIADKGGVIGINFYSLFLNEHIQGSTKEEVEFLIKNKNYKKLDEIINKQISKNDDIIKHLSYIRNVGGSDVLAFGSDFDGISCKLEMEDISGLPVLISLLEKAGFKDEEIEKLYYKNALRLFSDCL